MLGYIIGNGTPLRRAWASPLCCMGGYPHEPNETGAVDFSPGPRLQFSCGFGSAGRALCHGRHELTSRPPSSSRTPIFPSLFAFLGVFCLSAYQCPMLEVRHEVAC